MKESKNNIKKITAVYAHRGASDAFPENTMTAFRAAEAAGADGIELDVQRTRDGRVVIVHDECLDRLTGRTLLVKDLTYEELAGLNIAANRPSFEPERAPLFDAFLDWLSGTGLSVNIELKNSAIPVPGLEEDVLDAVLRRGLQNRTIVSSFSLESVCRMKALAPELECGYLVKRLTPAALRRARACHIDAIHPNVVNLFFPGFTRFLHGQGFTVRFWTVKTAGQMKRAFRKNADAVIANDPKAALALRRENQKNNA